MSLEGDLFDALSPLTATTPIGKACYPDAFPQNRGQPDPWPAIRYTFIDVVPGDTVCGSGGDEESDIRVQIDAVAETGAKRDTLRLAIVAAMAAFPTPLTLESWSKEYDTDSKGYRVRMDYFIQPSST